MMTHAEQTLKFWQDNQISPILDTPNSAGGDEEIVIIFGDSSTIKYEAYGGQLGLFARDAQNNYLRHW